MMVFCLSLVVIVLAIYLSCVLVRRPLVVHLHPNTNVNHCQTKVEWYTEEPPPGPTRSDLPWWFTDLDQDLVEIMQCVHFEYLAGDLFPWEMEKEIEYFMKMALDLRARDRRIAWI